MKAHPDELQQLITQYPKLAYGPVDYPLVSAFVDICEKLEPDLVLTTMQQRLEWRTGLELLRFQLKRWLGVDMQTGLKMEWPVALAELAAKTWRGPSAGVVRAMPFVKDAGLRAIAERDFASLEAARKHSDVKVALVLAGCIIEAVLHDVVARDAKATEAAARNVHAARSPKNPRVWNKAFDFTKADDWPLAQLVGVCGPDGLGVLDARAEQISDTVRDWRNFVHPRKELDETKASPLSLSEAIAAGALVDIVLDQVERA